MFFSINARATQVPLQVHKGSALRLRSPQAGVLRVTSGRVWATQDVRYPSDCVLARGAELQVPAGQTIVIEAWPLGLEDGSGLVWAQSAATGSAWTLALQRATLWLRSLPVFLDRHHGIGTGGSATCQPCR